jgi:dihydropteroate synthase-like protein
MPWKEILAKAEYYRNSGADIIDLGCPPRGKFDRVDRAVAGLKKRGFKVSLDSFDSSTILRADEAGLDLLLSINSQNMRLAKKLHCKVVVIPDFDDKNLKSLERNANQLQELGIPYIMDPVLDPINFGFTEALYRFYQTRRRHPNTEMLMGAGNITELTDADSTGINAVMAGIITELGIDYVLTTEVINWARGAVRELNHARKLMYYASQNRILPKNLSDSLIVLKDPPYQSFTEKELRSMQKRLRDRNFRVFTNDKWIYLFNRSTFIHGREPAEIFSQLGPIDSRHAFYLGRELERAALALRLGKKYVQEAELRWGYLSDE